MSGGRWTWMGLLAVTVSRTAGGATSVRVTFDLREVRTNTPVVGAPGGLLVPLRAVTRALGGQMRWDEATKTAVVEYRGRRLEVDERTRALRLNGRPLAGRVSPRPVNGQILVPLPVMERLFGVRGRWQPRRHLLGFAAAGGGGGPTGRRGDGATGRRTANNPLAASGLRLLMSSDRKTYQVGTPVRFTLSVTNPGRAPVTLQFSSGQKCDIVVRRGGQAVWRWAADRMFTQALTRMTLAPGEQQTFTETWKQQDNNGQPVPAGDYEAIATLTTMTRPQPQSAPITFRIGG